ncbi:hypothetical protein CEY16_06970 [Halalkalibacillus sediminis]|uniref:Phosphatidic acid phosphatase type 2/haloperoxidase domain-containing protein n=1 Tax=Halalkalibacillus sediminis TaxID=2018042 RepID=A0A2I0QTN8_9BACI|nr:phosphatase PAP2 family protein [Halalkalibacillus sediminis]PKR77668.1 hypothetical protein CEY16_06970 [Halalkalibacillus sediminis]
MMNTLKEIPARTYIMIFIALTVIGGGFYIFSELADEVLEQEKFIIDQWASEFVAQFSNPTLYTFLGWVTELGSVYTLTFGSIVLVAILAIYYKRRTWRIVYFIIAMGGIALLTTGLKSAFSRDRPNILEQYDGTGHSFPSGHSTAPMVFYGFIIYLIIRSHLNKAAKWALNTFLVILILSIGLSRVFLGVHFITDVFAGFLLGLSWLVTCILILEYTLWRKGRDI